MKIFNESILKWVLDIMSVTGVMTGSLLVALNSQTWSKWGYIAFLMGGTASLLITLRSNVSRSQVFLNGWYMIVNVIGIFRWFNL